MGHLRLEWKGVVFDLGYLHIDLLEIGMDGESEAVEVVYDIVCNEEMRGDFVAVFDHVHEFLNAWIVA